MASDKTKPAGGDRGNKHLNQFKEFQSAVISFVTHVPQAAIKAIGDDPDAKLAEANIATVQNIFKKSFARINAEFEKSNVVTQSEVSEFLEMTDGTNFAKTAERAAVQSFSAKIFGGGIWQWIGQNLTEIKKIIGMILGLFSQKLKEWWDRISVIIDEILNLVLSLLGSVFGLNRREIARELSMAEVNYLNEMTALQKLETARRQSQDNDET